MLLASLMVIVGLVLLILGGEWLVKGAVALALRLGVPIILVGLTLVAFGTSAPELLVSVTSALDGAPGIAFGNVIGSNVANILLIIGLPVMLWGMSMRECESRGPYLEMIGASLLFFILAFTAPFTWWHGVILLVALAGVLTAQIIRARKEGRDDPSGEIDAAAAAKVPTWQAVLFAIGGMIGLAVGSNWLVDGATVIARYYKVSDAVIGLTIVAIGTSLPELATSLSAGKKRQTNVIIGNVIGSNLFNILAILGVTSFFGPLPLDESLRNIGIPVMVFASLLIAPFVFRKNMIQRWVGAGFLVLYVGYLLASVSFGMV